MVTIMSLLSNITYNTIIIIAVVVDNWFRASKYISIMRCRISEQYTLKNKENFAGSIYLITIFSSNIDNSSRHLSSKNLESVICL